MIIVELAWDGEEETILPFQQKLQKCLNQPNIYDCHNARGGFISHALTNKKTESLNPIIFGSQHKHMITCHSSFNDKTRVTRDHGHKFSANIAMTL